MKQISLRLDDELAAAVELARGKQPREAWIRDLLIAAVAHPDTPAPGQYLSIAANQRVKREDEAARSVVMRRKAAQLAGHLPTCRCPVCRPPKGGKP